MKEKIESEYDQNVAVFFLTNTEVAKNIGLLFCGKTLEMFCLC